MFTTWSDLDLLTGVIYGEARGESWLGKIAVGLTVRTRVSNPGYWNWGKNWREVILAPRQFSCFKDINACRIGEECNDFRIGGGLGIAVWEECYLVATAIYAGTLKCSFGAISHYHNNTVQPSWAKELLYITTVGKHLFYTCFNS